MARRKIYAQGDLDGACFLYGIVNAYAALRREEPEFAAVCRAFGQVDHPGDFLNGSVGTTGSYDNDYGLLEGNIKRILAILGQAEFFVQRISGHFSADLLETLLGAQSVVLLRYTGSSHNAAGMDHWVCAVAYDRKSRETHVACSVRLQKASNGQGAAYRETLHEHGRWSNDILSDAHAHAVVDGEVFRIALQP